MLKISLLCTDVDHPIYPKLMNWAKTNQQLYDIEIQTCSSALRDDGDFLFLISCSELIPDSIRARFQNTLVLHASDLPAGRGWSPHIWQIIEGRREITLTLLEAEDEVDSGKIWLKKEIPIEATALYDEINAKIFAAELAMIDQAVHEFNNISPKKQADDVMPSYYRKRTPSDSRLDVSRTLQSQFDLIRVCDPKRYPAFFDYQGQRFVVKIEKIEHE